MTAQMPIAKFLLATVLATVAAAAAMAQTANASPPASLVGSWLVTVKGEATTRTLIVSEEAPTPSGALLKAAYGLSDKGQGPISAEMRVVDNKRQLLFVTQADTKVTATEQADGSFQGSFVIKSGRAMDVTLTRFTAETTAQIAQAKAMAGIQKPGADVPANCAAFSGGWGGEWPVQGYVYLWVMSIDAGCNAKVGYNRSSRPPTSAQGLIAATIKGNTLVMPRPDGGTTSFEMNGSSLDARYAGPSGANAATMQRFDAQTAARIDAEQRAAMAAVPPTPDVPAECAAYFGNWTGSWSTGNQGNSYFRVMEVKAAADHCTIRYSFTTSSNVVPARETAEIRKGTLTFICNQSTGGTCVFNIKSDGAIDARYSNPMGGTNTAFFTRIK